MHGVVFHPAAKHLHSAVKFVFPADDRLQFIVTGQRGKVNGKTLQRGFF
jgi:hypothetical protein